MDKFLSQSCGAECAAGHSSRFAESGFRLKACHGYRGSSVAKAGQLAVSYRGTLFIASARYWIIFFHAA
jgi:hypothetical protein